ncbi:MAG: tRNA pseudouridine(38-40) synthase TruA [Caldisericia bacterium]|nr:tRNA pseudouridine(38-40) synthase TruA [Caldisericia bacterium]
MVKNIKLTLMYDGTNFFGTQKNKNLRTVEGVLEITLKKIINIENIDITFASRTDRGVHAIGQVANFLIDTNIPGERFKNILNNKLPSDIKVKESIEIENNFSSRFNSKGKIYIFFINYSKEEPHPIIDRYSLWFPYEINLDRLYKNLKLFEGERDFSSFTTEEERREVSTIREIYETNLIKKNNFLILYFFGKSFLRHQIRRMVGALLEIERRNLKSEVLIEAFKSKKHFIGEKKVSSRGLFLYKVIY